MDDQDDLMDSQNYQDDRIPNQDDQGGTNTTLGPPQPLQVGQLQSKEYKARRKKAMQEVHKTILPSLLGQGPDEWWKVFDKDTKLTYRALYFSVIKKRPGEKKNAFIQRVGKIRHDIAEEVHKLKETHQVNFKINSLLSKPFLYDEEALEEQTMKATQSPGMK